MSKKRKIISIISLILVAVLISGGWALWRYVIPKSEIVYNLAVPESNIEYLFSIETDDNDVKISQTSYESNNVKINIETIASEDLVYYVADVILSDSTFFHSAFAQDEFGQNINEDALALANRNNAILAINGDFYGWRSDGIIIRNGKLYRNKPVRDMCAIYSDGTMKILDEKEYSSDEKIIELLNDGVIDTFSYGPALIINDEKISDFSSYEHYLNKKHPRTAIGMIESNHFVFVVVDGRINESEGVDLNSLADIMADLGCSEAYNLDGGKSSIMIFNNEKINILKNRDLSDIIYISE